MITKQDVSPPKGEKSSFIGHNSLVNRPQSISFIEKFSKVLSREPIPIDLEKKPAKQMVYKILRTEELKYIHEYWQEYFENLRKTESHSMVKKVLDRHQPVITRYLRAHLIDWLTHVCDVLPKEDFTLPFIATNMTDRFFMLTNKTIRPEDMQLTGLTALFMVSKYLEITPLFLDQLVNEMGYRKYKAKEFVDRETELMSQLACEIDPPTHLDFTLLYSKFIRSQVQNFRGPIMKPTLTFLLTAEYYACEYCKMLLADLDMLSVRPSILAATAIKFGLEYSERYCRDHQVFDAPLPEGKTKADLEEEITSISTSWEQIATTLLHEVADYAEIAAFTREIEERMVFIEKKHGKKFTTIFKNKVTRYFPEIYERRGADFEDKYKDII
jgi:hypothetical protein